MASVPGAGAGGNDARPAAKSRYRPLRASLLASAAVGACLWNAPQAQAYCGNGTTGDDTIVCDAGTVTSINAYTGNDSITLGGATTTGTVLAGEGSDTVTMTGGTVGTYLALGNSWASSNPGDINSFTMTGGAINATGTAILGDEGMDTFNLQGGTIAGTIYGRGGDDIFNLDGTTIGGQLGAGLGDDTVTMTAGSVSRLNLEGGNDSLTMTGGSIGGNVSGGAGVDTIMLNGGTIGGLVLAGTEDDVIVLDGTAVGQDVRGEDGNDSITLTSGSALNVLGGNGDDSIVLDGTTLGGSVRGDAGNDSITLTAGSTVQVRGGTGDDTILLQGATLTTSLLGDAGNDTITMTSGSIGGALYLGTADFSSADTNSLTMSGGSVTFSVVGDLGVDTMTLTGGSVGTDVDAKDGDDIVTLDGTAVAGAIIGGAGNDSLALTSGSVGNGVDMGVGDDAVTLTGAAITGAIALGDGSDVMTVAAGADLSAVTILDGGDDTLAADGWVDTLTFDGYGGTAAVSNWEVMNLINNSSLGFADGTAFGLLSIQSGLVDLGTGAMTLNGDIDIAAGGSMTGHGGGAGSYTLNGNVANEGTISTRDGATGDTVTVAGDYSGSGTVALDVDMAAGSADSLHIQGDMTGGTMAIDANMLTTGDGEVRIATVDGAVAGDFTLNTGSASTLFDYSLGTDASNNLFFISAVTDLNSTYYATPSAAMYFGLAQQGTLHDRVGTVHDEKRGKLWYRMTLGHAMAMPETNGGAPLIYDQAVLGHEIGADVISRTEKSPLSAGLIFGMGDSSVSINGSEASVDIAGYNVGAYASWTRDEGYYLDVSAKYHVLDISTQSHNATSQATVNYDASMVTAAVEGGLDFHLPLGLEAQPGVRAVYGNYRSPGFTDADGFEVGDARTESLIGQAVLRIERPFESDGDGAVRYKSLVPHVQFIYSEELLGESSQSINDGIATLDMTTSTAGTRYGAEIGISGWMNKSVQLYAQGRYTMGDTLDHGVEVAAGVRARF